LRSIKPIVGSGNVKSGPTVLTAERNKPPSVDHTRPTTSRRGHHYWPWYRWWHAHSAYVTFLWKMS